MPRPRSAKNFMNSVTSSPSTCGPMTTPSTSSATTVGTSTPRAVIIVASVPATAAVATTARKLSGLIAASGMHWSLPLAHAITHHLQRMIRSASAPPEVADEHADHRDEVDLTHEHLQDGERAPE